MPFDELSKRDVVLRVQDLAIMCEDKGEANICVILGIIALVIANNFEAQCASQLSVWFEPHRQMLIAKKNLADIYPLEWPDEIDDDQKRL